MVKSTVGHTRGNALAQMFAQGRDLPLPSVKCGIHSQVVLGRFWRANWGHFSRVPKHNLSELEFGASLRRLTAQIQDMYGRPDVTVDIQVEEIPLGLETAVPLGLIANELIINAFQHAFPLERGGHITVSLARQRPAVDGEHLDAQITLRVEDDGIGFPAGYDIGTATTMGIRIVRLLAEQITADVHVETVTGVGWTLTFFCRRVH